MFTIGICICSSIPKLFDVAIFLAFNICFSCQNKKAQSGECKSLMTHIVVCKSDVNEIWIV